MNMKKEIRLLIAFTIAIVSICAFDSCKKDKNTDMIDKELYDMAKSTTGFAWYKDSEALLDKSSGSGHTQPFLRTRYNSVASTQLDANGQVKAAVVFPEGSLIVKELFSGPATLDQYAILYKKPDNPNADANGWVWGYVKADGTVVEPASNKGNACITCHSQTDNINYTLMNKFFP